MRINTSIELLIVLEVDFSRIGDVVTFTFEREDTCTLATYNIAVECG
jgi:hypothetical protein